MESLPIEILQQMCFACDFRTAKNLRCSSRVFDQLAARAIFRNVYVAIFDESMTKMLKIAHHPVLRCYVHKLWFLNALLDEAYTDYEVWEEAVDLRKYYFDEGPEAQQVGENAPHILLEGQDLESNGWPLVHDIVVTPEVLKARHERFVSLFWAQRGIVAGETQEKRFRVAFANLSNLREVKNYNVLSTIAITHPRDAHDAFKAESRRITPFVTRLQQETFLAYPFDLVENRDRYVDQEHSVVAKSIFCILKVLGTSEHNVRVIDFANMPKSIWQQSSSMTYWPRYHTYTEKAFHDLRELRVQFSLLPLRDSDTDPLSIPFQISKFLCSATSLTTADLDFVDNRSFSMNEEEPSSEIMGWGGSLVADVSTIFQRVWWPKLRELRIFRCGLTEHAFISFMKRHSDHLKILNVGTLNLVMPMTVTGVDVRTSNWQRAIQRVAPCMSLDAVKIEYIQDAFQKACNDIAREEYEKIPFAISSLEALARWREHGRRVSDYLRHRGLGPYPQWYDQDLRPEKWQHEDTDWGPLRYRLATLRLT